MHKILIKYWDKHNKVHYCTSHLLYLEVWIMFLFYPYRILLNTKHASSVKNLQKWFYQVWKLWHNQWDLRRIFATTRFVACNAYLVNCIVLLLLHRPTLVVLNYFVSFVRLFTPKILLIEHWFKSHKMLGIPHYLLSSMQRWILCPN